ncbi:MAG: hypothetical protein PHV82_09285 [Victivallaceae bacterium]|nr:hypothetical protein [Victivallaceae bacterium]
MFRKKQKAKRDLLLFKTDTKTYAVLRSSKGILARNDFIADTPTVDLLSWGKNQDASTVRIMELSDLYDLAVNWEDTLEFEENVEAVNYELSSLSGKNAVDIRPSVIRGNSIDNCKHGFICSGFDLKDIKDTVQVCVARKLFFQGKGSIQQLLLIHHFSNPELQNEVMLFFTRNGTCAAFLEQGKIVIRNMPFGLPDEHGQKQWETRAERRLNGFTGHKICLYLEQAPEGFKEKLENIIASKVDVRILDEIFPELSSIAVTGNVDKLEILSLAGTPPRVKDPREVGTMICILLIGSTIILLLFQYLALKITKNTLEGTLKHKKDIQHTIKSHEGQIAKSGEQLQKFRQLFSMVKNRQHIDPDFIKVINLLGRYKLKYTKINRIQELDNGIAISGETYWQPDLSRFFAHFEKQLAACDLNLMPEGLEKVDNMRLAFKCKISRRRK